MMAPRFMMLSMDAVAPEIEEAVFEADVFGIFGVAEYRQRQFGGLRKHLDFGGEEFDEAGRQIVVLRAGRAQAQLAVDAHHPFGAQLLGLAEGG